MPLAPDVAAGIDVGNATTEVVLAVDGVPVAADRAMTRGAKGSETSLRAAAALVRRMSRRAGVAVTRGAVAPLRPVHTTTAVVPTPPPDTGPYAVLRAGAATPGGSGVGVGRPVPLGSVPLSGSPVVALVPASVGFAAAAARLRELLAGGAPVVGVLLAADEARLVANRLPVGVPVVDGVDVDVAGGATVIAVEVAPAGSPLRHLTDPLYVANALGGSGDAATLRRVARRLHDVSSAVVALGAVPPVPGEPPSFVWGVGGPLPLADAAAALPSAGPGAYTRYSLAGTVPIEVADLALVDVDAVATSLLLRADVGSGGHALAALLAVDPAASAAESLADLLDVPVTLAPSEASAARAGALTTPGAGDDTVVVDLGGGTVDVIGPAGESVLAGGGDLLTAAVALALGCTRGAAEWAKRGPAVRVETPQRITREDGDRGFLDTPQPAGTVGWLAAPGPAGLLPFSSRLGPAEWRALRLALKQSTLGVAVKRGLRTLTPASVLVVGGPAGDDEVLRTVDAALGDTVGLGRGNVAGTLGHRYAVAWGLAALALTE